MTTPTNTPTPTNDRMTAAEIRELFNMLRGEIEQNTIEINGVIAELHAMREGLTIAAAKPAPATNSGQFTEMMIDSIIMTYSDKGEPAYKATGAPYNKFGVRVWPETLPILGIDPATLKPGPNQLDDPIKANVLMNQPQEGKTAQPRKVTGRA